jgi:hypothetical protein
MKAKLEVMDHFPDCPFIDKGRSGPVKPDGLQRATRTETTAFMEVLGQRMTTPVT